MTTTSNERHMELLATLGELIKYWRSHPELRLGQVIYNFTTVGLVDSYHVPDAHYREALAAANRATAEALSAGSGTDTRTDEPSPQMSAEGATP